MHHTCVRIYAHVYVAIYTPYVLSIIHIDYFPNLCNHSCICYHVATVLCSKKRKLRLGLSITKQDSCDVQSKQANTNPRLEAINLQYESVDGPQHAITDYNYVIIPARDKNNLSSNNTAVTTKNDPAIIDSPAYSTGDGPPLIDNPAYIATKDCLDTTILS